MNNVRVVMVDSEPSSGVVHHLVELSVIDPLGDIVGPQRLAAAARIAERDYGAQSTIGRFCRRVLFPTEEARITFVLRMS